MSHTAPDKPSSTAAAPGALLCVRVPQLVGVLAALAMLAGLAGLDGWLANALARHALLDAAVFVHGMHLIDTLSGLRAGAIWAAGLALLAIGLIWLAARHGARHAQLLVATGTISVIAMACTTLLKHVFGRLRPFQMEALQASSEMGATWFAGGTSFPSGHAAFYFGLFLPLAAGIRPGPMRVIFLAVPIYVAAARINMNQHYLSDVAASALLVSLLCMAVGHFRPSQWITRLGGEASRTPAPPS